MPGHVKWDPGKREERGSILLEKIADEVILFIMLTVCILIKILKELAVIVFKVQESRHRYHKVPPGVPDFILDVSLLIA